MNRLDIHGAEEVGMEDVGDAGPNGKVEVEGRTGVAESLHVEVVVGMEEIGVQVEEAEMDVALGEVSLVAVGEDDVLPRDGIQDPEEEEGEKEEVLHNQEEVVVGASGPQVVDALKTAGAPSRRHEHLEKALTLPVSVIRFAHQFLVERPFENQTHGIQTMILRLDLVVGSHVVVHSIHLPLLASFRHSYALDQEVLHSRRRSVHCRGC